MPRRLPLRFVAAVALAAGPACADDTIFANGFQRPWVMGYHVGYQRGLLPLDEIDFATVTHLVVGRVTPNSNGSVNTHFDIDTVNGPIWAAAAASAAHAAGAKAVLMVGGAGEHAGWIGAAAPANRAVFVANLLAVLDDLGYDGLDLDWEPILEADKPNLLAVAQALRTARPGLLLTIPVGWVNANFATPDPYYGTLAIVFDQINAMTYDMAGAWDGWQSWHSSAFDGAAATTPSSVQSSVDWYRRSGVPRARLGLGLPFYGTCWRGVGGPRQNGGSVVASDNVISYAAIVGQYDDPSRRQWDALAQVPYLGASSGFGPAQCTFLSYDDAASIALKGAWARRQGLGGTIVWTIGQGHLPDAPAGQRDPLLQAIRAAF